MAHEETLSKEEEENRTLAKCLKTYPDEGDMLSYCNGDIEPCEVQIFYKGETYYVNRKHVNTEYYKIIE